MNANAQMPTGPGRPVHPWVAEGGRRLRFAICGAFASKPDDIIKAAQRAESLGFDAYWANDHPNRSMDCWGQLTMLAMATEKIRLISLVSCIYYRTPFLLARQAADVDRVSGGRLVLGLGVGDDVPEFNEMCLDFPPLKQRQETLEETVAIVRGLWRGERFSFEGKYFRVREAAVRQLPVQEPYVPVLIGGGGERVTLRQVARLADVSNFAPHEWSGSAFQVTDVIRKYEALRRHCADVGRPYDSVLRTHYTPLLTLAEDDASLERKRAAAHIPDASLHQEVVFATPAQAVRHYQALADAGVQYFLASINFQDEETVRLFAEEVVPAVHLPPAGP
jgi:alkanesulfonate monooxygenase SsuD/methylene tetrahydromethanopterin reductase-like flavin-dependent oxidoreductase (luciferase family)